MILIITNTLRDELYNTVINNAYLRDASRGKIQVVKEIINDENKHKFARLISNKPYQLIIIDSSSLEYIDILKEIKEAAKCKVVVINNNQYTDKDFYINDIYNFVNYTKDNEKFAFDLLDASVRDIVTHDKIRLVTDSLRLQNKHFVILNSRVVDQKFMQKYLAKNQLHLVDGNISKLQLFKELLSLNDELIFIDGSLRLCEAMYELMYDFEYIDDRERHSDLPVYVVEYKRRSRRKLKRMLNKKIKMFSGE